jgi:hypothetical protein
MNSFATERFWKLYDNLPEDIRQAADKAYDLWKDIPNHPSLHFKRVHTKRPIWSVRITEGYRAVGTRDGDTMIWLWIGNHNEYEQLLKRL